MVITKVYGGLGNQMFQYAAALCLASLRGVTVRYDLSWFRRYHLHQGFELHRVFSVEIPEATGLDYFRVLGWRGHHWLRAQLLRPSLRALRPAAYVQEPHYQFWPGFHSLPGRVYLDGYWHSERYFIAAERLVRDAFRFRHPLSGRNLELSQHMASCNSVAVHVRRGDFASDPAINAVHGLTSLAYYRAAIGLTQARIEDPCYFVFSDDMEWAREHLQIDAPCSYVDHNRGLESYNDLRLMSLCKHHIIANSTFSWWGAWLGQHPGQHAVAPSRWFQAQDKDTADLIPARWERI